MDAPRVSIITSTYNRSAVLRRAIQSVRAQRGFDDWEMCIVGDCTPDDSEAVVSSFGDPRLLRTPLLQAVPGRGGQCDGEQQQQQQAAGARAPGRCGGGGRRCVHPAILNESR